MREHAVIYPVEKMSVVLKVSSSGYYKWLGTPVGKREKDNIILLKNIQRVYDASKKRYGSPRIAASLKLEGIPASRPRIARLMSKNNICSITRKKYRTTTDSNHDHIVPENHLNRDFVAIELAQKWVGDITYIPTGEGWLYLASVIDLADRQVVGWSMADNMTARDTTVAAWNMAVKNRPIVKELLFHSDRGVQYACGEFCNVFDGLPIVQSMSRKGNCWDNAVAESFFKTIKTELIYHRKFTTRAEAKLEIFDYIEVWYNKNRIHSALGYLTPKAFEQSLISKRKREMMMQNET